MFTGEASAALEFYTSVFTEFRIERMERYGAGEAGLAGGGQVLMPTADYGFSACGLMAPRAAPARR
jgi:predicted 3-demethylubiquinone-9 3-methyltransferase (glyoxalase superfamily)